MIVNYIRPQSLDEAVTVLSRIDLVALPMGGGTTLSQAGGETPITVVDLQKIGLDKIKLEGDRLLIGATTHLQALVEHPACPEYLRTAIVAEFSRNLRNMKTLAGALTTSDGQSVLTCVLMAADSNVIWAPGEKSIRLGDWLPLRGKHNYGKLITKIELSLAARVQFEAVGRTPKDRPSVCVAIAQWESGRTRLVLGAPGENASLINDGASNKEFEFAIKNACSHLIISSNEISFTQEIAINLIRRLLEVNDEHYN